MCLVGNWVNGKYVDGSFWCQLLTPNKRLWMDKEADTADLIVKKPRKPRQVKPRQPIVKKKRTKFIILDTATNYVPVKK